MVNFILTSITSFQTNLIKGFTNDVPHLNESSPQSCVKVQPHQKHNVLRCEPNCHAFLSEERGQEQ